VTAFARGWERRPSKYRVGPGGDLGRRFGERGSDSASLAHRSAEEVVGASTTIEASDDARTPTCRGLEGAIGGW
jgi:hypothetical protein